MKSILLFLTVLMTLSATAQKPYSISKDEETGAQIFKGPITLADLNGEPSFKWMKTGVSSYTPDPNAIAYLQKALHDCTVIAVMGTWCDDSQNFIPKLAKILDKARFPMANFAMWGVDRAKQTGGIESRLYNVKKVPTIIVFKGNKEVGRIVESVNRSIELDIAQMLEKDEQ